MLRAEHTEPQGPTTAHLRSEPRRRPLLPDVDPFYRPPQGFETSAPGTILRSREVTVALVGVVPLRCRSYQLLCRSTDLHGNPEAVVTTVLAPTVARSAVSGPLLAYQCAIDAITGSALPSYVLQWGSRSMGTVPQFELLIIANALRRGWTVSIVDHVGARGRFGAPREPGHRVLDGVRAAVGFAPLSLCPDVRVAAWGYSGGGMATAWAAEMAPVYAPELNLVGAVLGAPVGDPGSTFVRLNGTWLAALPVMVVAGIRHVYPRLDDVLRTHSTDTGLRRLDLIERLSQFAAMVRFAGDDLEGHLDIPLADMIALPAVLEVFDDLRLGSRAPTCPLLVVHAVHDQVIDVDDVDEQVQRYLNGGARVRYLRDRCSEHVSLLPLSAPTALDWLADRFAQAALPPVGVRTVFSTALSTTALRELVRMAGVALCVVAGRDVSRPS